MKNGIRDLCAYGKKDGTRYVALMDNGEIFYSLPPAAWNKHP